MCRPSKIDGRCEIRLLYLLKTLILYNYKLYVNYTEGLHFSAFIIFVAKYDHVLCNDVMLLLTLGAHAHSEGYSSCRVCMCVCVYVCVYVCMCVCMCV